MKNIKFKNIIFKKVNKFNNYLIDKFNQINAFKKKINKVNKFNNYLIDKFNQINILKNKLNKINFLKKKFNQISNLNKTLISSISILFLYLFYVSIPSLYDYKKLQSQLKKQLYKDYNLIINISDKIQYKILPSPHFEIKESILYGDSEEDGNKVGELKNLKIFIYTKNIYSQKNLKLKNIIIKDSLFFLNKNNRKFVSSYFNNKNTDKKIKIKKSNFFLMNKDEIVSIFPIKNIDFIYDEKLFTNSANVSGLIYNSDFKLEVIKKFLGDESLDFDLKLPKINLSVKNNLLPDKKDKDKFKVFNKINFFGSEIKSEIDIDKNFSSYKSIKSKIFNNQIDFVGSVEFKPFYLKSNIILNEINLVKILTSNSLPLTMQENENLIHKNFNSKILVDIKKFTNDNIFDTAKISIETQNGLIKFDDTVFISEKFGSLKLFNSKLYNKNKKLYFRSNILIDVKNKKKFYNILQIEKIFRKDIKKINFAFETNLTVGKTKITNFQIDNVISKELTSKINKIMEDNNIDFNKNFNNWIVLKRFINMIISEANQD